MTRSRPTSTGTGCSSWRCRPRWTPPGRPRAGQRSATTAGQPLTEMIAPGRLTGSRRTIHRVRAGRARGRRDRRRRGPSELSIATVALGAIASGRPDARADHGRPRPDGSFSDDDLELLRSLAHAGHAGAGQRQPALRRAAPGRHRRSHRAGHPRPLPGAARRRDGARCAATSYPVGLVMIDIDDFKSINDVYGHQQGDIVLRHVAEVLRENSRDVDVAARYGGEEMALILPHTDLDGTYRDRRARPRGDRGSSRYPLLEGTGPFRSPPASALPPPSGRAQGRAHHRGRQRSVRGQARGQEPNR